MASAYVPRTGGRPGTLVVDDDPIMRLMATESLEVAGFDTVEAADGFEALEAFDRLRPELILLDVKMPQMNGFDTCRAIRGRPGGADVPILMMTGVEDLSAIDQAYDAGATDFVTKPLNYHLLGYRLRYMLRARDTLSELKRSQEWLTNAQHVAKLGYFDWGLGEPSLSCSREAAAIFGLDEGDTDLTIYALLRRLGRANVRALFAALRETMANLTRFRAELVIPYLDGSHRHVIVEGDRGPPGLSGERVRLFGAVQDVTERRHREARLRELSLFDATTALPNRRYLVDRIQAHITRAPRRRCAVLCVAIGNLREIRNSFGPATADAVLREAALRVTPDGPIDTTTRTLDLATEEPCVDTVARVANEELAVLVTAVDDGAQVGLVVDDVMRALTRPVDIGEATLYLTASVGVGLYPNDAMDGATLLRSAMAAANQPTPPGGGSHRYYDRAMDARARQRIALEAAMRKALDRSEFELYYQPKIALASGRTSGAEALLRWSHSEFGQQGPGFYIPVAEATGLIVPLSEWIVGTALSWVRRWWVAMDEPLTVAVNVSPHHFVQRSFVSSIREALERSAVPASLLQLEVTEGVLMSDTELSQRHLGELRAIGVSIALDDFGTGYSSLRYLHKLPIDVLKIDRSFISSATQSDTATIVSAILTLARRLGIKVVAEGVETADQLRFLRDEGCDEVQGHFYSPALNEGAFDAWMRGRAVPARAGLPPRSTAGTARNLAR